MTLRRACSPTSDEVNMLRRARPWTFVCTPKKIPPNAVGDRPTTPIGTKLFFKRGENGVARWMSGQPPRAAGSTEHVRPPESALIRARFQVWTSRTARVAAVGIPRA